MWISYSGSHPNCTVDTYEKTRHIVTRTVIVFLLHALGCVSPSSHFSCLLWQRLVEFRCHIRQSAPYPGLPLEDSELFMRNSSCLIMVKSTEWCWAGAKWIKIAFVSFNKSKLLKKIKKWRKEIKKPQNSIC